eukprot:3940276-Rhodomonas_salina.1
MDCRSPRSEIRNGSHVSCGFASKISTLLRSWKPREKVRLKALRECTAFSQLELERDGRSGSREAGGGAGGVHGAGASWEAEREVIRECTALSQVNVTGDCISDEGARRLGGCLRSACEVLAKCLRSACKVLAKCLQSACEVLVKCLRSACEVLAKCLRSACEVLAWAIVGEAERRTHRCRCGWWAKEGAARRGGKGGVWEEGREGCRQSDEGGGEEAEEREGECAEGARMQCGCGASYIGCNGFPIQACTQHCGYCFNGSWQRPSSTSSLVVSVILTCTN